MPVIKSAIKRVRQQKVRQARNLVVKKKLNAKTKSFMKVASAKTTAKLQPSLIEVISQIDKAAKAGLLHKNTAARRKAKLTKIYNQVSAQPFGSSKTKKARPAVAKTKAKSTPKTADKTTTKKSTSAKPKK